MVARLISPFFVFCLIFLGSYAYGQQALLKRKLTISTNNERLEDVLMIMSEEGSFSFSYNPDLLPVDSLVSISLRGASVKTALNTLLGNNVDYKVSGNMLVILKTDYTDNQVTSTDDDKKNYTIDGYLRNAETGAYLASKTVYDIKGFRSATTDENGYFSLDLPAKERVVALKVAGEEFEENAVVIVNQDQEVNIPVVASKRTSLQNDSSAFVKAQRLNQSKIVKFVTSEEGIARSGYVEVQNYRIGQVSFLPFAGTNLLMSGAVENKFSLNVLAGYNGAVDGVEVGGLVNITKLHVEGVQLGGIGNIVGTETRGAQFAGIFNTNFGNVNGAQFSGINNFVLDSLEGIQVSGINNTTLGHVNGTQIAGINNVARQNVDGIQIAGISNIAFQDVNKLQIAGVINFGRDISGAQFAGILNAGYGKVNGLQVAGIMNVTRNVRTLQLAGISNIAIDTVHGAQVAPIFNFGRYIKGFQVGLVNVGYSTEEGTSVGLVNLFWKGYNKLEVATNDMFVYNVRAKLGSRRFYNIFGYGSEGFQNDDIKGYTYGIGKVIAVGKKGNDLNFDLTVTDFQVNNEFGDGLGLNNRLGIHYGFKINSRFMIYGGPVFNHLIYDRNNSQERNFLENLPPYELYSSTIGDNINVGWVGFEFGIRLL
ncbi:MAG: STN domain-containing protein [Bacteroidota bacterium]